MGTVKRGLIAAWHWIRSWIWHPNNQVAGPIAGPGPATTPNPNTPRRTP